MKIHINDFGPIHSLTFDLRKNLHLIYGRNAIGKSYAIYCLYCLLKSFRDKDFYNDFGYRYTSFLERRGTGPIDFAKELSLKETRSKKTQVDILPRFRNLLQNELKTILLDDFRNSLLNTFSTLKNLQNRFTKEFFKIRIDLDGSTEVRSLTISANGGEELDLQVELKFASLEYIEKPTKTTKFSLNKDGFKLIGKPTERELIEELKHFFYNCVGNVLSALGAPSRDIYFLPASRSGLFQGLNSFAPIIAELTQSRFFIANKKIELPSLSEPVSDYYIDLSTINKKYANREFEELADYLEQEILKGSVEFDDKTKNITYRPNGLKLSLNLSEASSMVAELSPLVLYFRHIINHKFESASNYRPNVRRTKKGQDVLFIEEPEAHLHPEVQVEMMKVFIELASKAKVFITSHSNYMFHELNNLVLGKEIDSSVIAVYHLVESKRGTVLADDMEVLPDGINDANFQETSENLYEQRMRLLEGLEEDD